MFKTHDNTDTIFAFACKMLAGLYVNLGYVYVNADTINDTIETRR